MEEMLTRQLQQGRGEHKGWVLLLQRATKFLILAEIWTATNLLNLIQKLPLFSVDLGICCLYLLETQKVSDRRSNFLLYDWREQCFSPCPEVLWGSWISPFLKAFFSLLSPHISQCFHPPGGRCIPTDIHSDSPIHKSYNTGHISPQAQSLRYG